LRSLASFILIEQFEFITLEMGKFYVLIHLAGKDYKLCRDDVSLVHSRHRASRPPVPIFALSGTPSASSNDLATEPDDSSMQFEPLELVKPLSPRPQHLRQ
jgi:hypothetical protein